MKNRVKLTDEFICALFEELISESGKALDSGALISEEKYFKGVISNVGGIEDTFKAIISIECDGDGYIREYDFTITLVNPNSDSPYRFMEYKTLIKYASRFYELYEEVLTGKNDLL